MVQTDIQQGRMDLGIITIATGKYVKYVDGLAKSINENLVADKIKTIFVLTDDTKVSNYTSETNVAALQREWLPWPLSTLMRFHDILKHKELFKQYDYLMFIDADMIINEEVVVEDVMNDLFGVWHPGFVREGSVGPFERNPKSTAYLPNNYGGPYLQGCLFGGKTSNFLELCETIAHNIEEDLKHNYIAQWHDESHLNKYFSTKLKDLTVLSPSFAYPEKWDLPFARIITHLDKNHNEIRSK